MSTAAIRLSGETRADAGRDMAVMAFVADDMTRQTLVRLAVEQKWRDPVIETGGIATARKELAQSSSPTLLIVDLSESGEPLADINSLADVCEPGTRVIALGTVNDVRLYRGLTEAGVADYLVKPVTALDLARAVTHAITGGKPEAAEGKRAHVTAVIGARGGIGASTVALNLAWLMSQDYKQRVVLVDLDLHFGTIALSLDIETGSGFRDVLQNPSRIDPLFLERAATPVNDRLAILGTEEPLVGSNHWSPEAFVPLLSELSKSFDQIVLDLPRTFAIQHSELVAAAATTLMVTDLSLPAMRDTLRLKGLVREAAPQTRLKLVVNHHRPASKGDMPRAEFERSIDEKIICDIAYDAKGAAQAVAAGRPLAAVAKKSKSVESLHKLTQDLAAAKAKKRSFALARLFRS